MVAETAITIISVVLRSIRLGTITALSSFQVARIQVGRESRYAYSDIDRDELIAEARKRRSGSGEVPIQRYEGLGEMNPEQLWDTTMNPATRTILRVDRDDAVLADETFEMLMGDQVPPRKKFIQTHAKSMRNIGSCTVHCCRQVAGTLRSGRANCGEPWRCWRRYRQSALSLPSRRHTGQDCKQRALRFTFRS